MGLYIEALIRTDAERLWARTQDPAQHQRWDLRFTEISPLPGPADSAQRFRYATRVLPFLTVAGTGTSAGERERADGERVSALRFASSERLSLLAEGSGYWRYVPTADGIRFLTGYDYRTRWGRFGTVADRLVFRPLMGWATAWSFDRLRLWCERDIGPARSLAHALAEVLVRLLLVAAALPLGPAAVLPAALAALLVPPSPLTPAARRCLRRPPGRPAVAPSLLARLERP
ncbi:MULTISPECIES: hypothetical protein [Streptomyces]|uniref:Membrane protein YndG n=1 Tax=Streptomyces sindenensis TaxID=67363 RepID=A0ABW6EIQ0_9ACTN|nr:MULTISPECIES: hypothetical protein [Streptomyces]WGP14145.1 hypothetical protein QFA72_32940 [Streptomyces sp. SH5]GGP62428.1 hypothetical protein GCM10010231_36620 [Streptomyces sindenensis]